MSLKGEYEIKLGKSFLDKTAPSYMTVRYDFMPASVDKSEPGSISFEDGKNVTVSLPAHSGNITFDGPARPVSKECVLMYNKRTKEMTLERISYVAQLKKNREAEPKHISHEKPQHSSLQTSTKSKVTRSISDSDSSDEDKKFTKNSKTTTDRLKELRTELSCSDSEEEEKTKKTPLAREPFKTTLNRNLIESDLKLSESDSSSDSD